MAGAVNKLQHLDHEFDFADTSSSKLDVTMQVLMSNDVPFDAALDRRDFIEQIGRGTFRKNERLMSPQKFVSEFIAATNPARLDQRKSLPGFAKSRIIILHAVQRTHEGTGASFRPQPQIDPKERPGGIGCGKRINDLVREAREPFVIIETRSELAFVGVEKDYVDVRAMIELASTEFTETENGELSLR